MGVGANLTDYAAGTAGGATDWAIVAGKLKQTAATGAVAILRRTDINTSGLVVTCKVKRGTEVGVGFNLSLTEDASGYFPGYYVKTDGTDLKVMKRAANAWSEVATGAYALGAGDWTQLRIYRDTYVVYGLQGSNATNIFGKAVYGVDSAYTSGYVGVYAKDVCYFQDLDVRTSYQITCTGLPPGWKLQVEGDSNRRVTAIAGVATLDVQLCLFPLISVEVLNASNVVQAQITDDMLPDMGGGDSFAYTSDDPGLIWGVADTDFASFGAIVRTESGLLDLTGLERDEISMAGRDQLSYAVKRRSYPQASVGLMLTAANQPTLLENWANLKALVSPAKGFQALTRSDLPGKQLYVRAVEMAGERDASNLPPTVMETSVTFDRYPYWEGQSETVTNPIASSPSVPSPILGNVPIEPVWEVTFSGASTGIDFETADGNTEHRGRFKTTTSYVAGDMLSIDVANGTVTKTAAGVTTTSVAGIDTATSTAIWPRLWPGVYNLLAVYAGSNYSIRARYRARYE